MRFASVVATLALIVPFAANAQPNGLSMANYQLQSTTTVSGSIQEETYTALLFNAGPAKTTVTATVTSFDDNIVVVPGRNVLHFSPVPGTSSVPSADTFTVRVDRSQQVFFSQLRWTFQIASPPVANAGPNQTAQLGDTVTLNGSGSTNPGGQGTLTYSWAFTSKPANSSAVLNGANSVSPSFVVNPAGTYVIQLTVSNGSASSTASVTVSGSNTRPVANAGPNQTVPISSTVNLNGGGSSDVDGNPLTYSWSLISKPSGSTAILTGATTATPSFFADLAGSYIAQLVVNDGLTNSTPASVTINTGNSAPVANAGINRVVALGSLVQLSGAGSTDVDGNPLTYSWSLISKPDISLASLSSAVSVNPSFTADKAGSYVVQLTVNDGQVSSAPVTVTISTSSIQPPVANAGPDQTVGLGSSVTIGGVGTDPQGLPLTYQYQMTSKPAGSLAALLGAGSAATFVADRTGNYVIQLIVNNGTFSSPPDTVVVSTANTAPVANPGVNITRTMGSIDLDGRASSDADGDPLTYAWSLTTKPGGSNASLTNTTSSQPSFVADVAGVYVAQLIVNDGIANSSPQTVSITVINSNTLTLSPTPLTLALEATSTLTLTLSTPAGPGGTVFALTSSNAGLVSVTPSAFIAEGSTSTTVTITAHSNTGTATILATTPGLQPAGAVVTVASTQMTLSATSPVIGIGVSTTGTVTVTIPAPPGGAVLNLSASPASKVSIPSTVTIPNGATSATFSIQGTEQGSVDITASSAVYGTATTNLSVSLLGQIFLPQNVSVAVGQSVPYSVTLSNGAGPGGVTVTLQSSNTSVMTISPSTVTIPAGQQTPTVSPQVTGVAFGSATVVASAPSYQSLTQGVTVTGALSFAQLVLAAGTNSSQTAQLLLNAPAPAGLTINLYSDNPAVASVPATVQFAMGETSVNIPVTFGTAGSTTLRASALPTLAEVSIPVTVASLGGLNLPSGQNVSVGETLAFPVTLSQPAPAGGVTVTLQSSNNSVLTIAPASVTIQAGQTAPGAQPQVTGVALGVATISAVASGQISASRVVSVGAASSFSPASATINGVQVQNLTLNLAVPAPIELTVLLSSSSPSVASVPSSVNVPQGATSVVVPVTSVGSGTTTITATPSSLFRPTTAGITVFVAVQGSIQLSGTMNLALGQSAALPLTISPAAPAGGVTINLTSTNPAVTVTPSVTIPAGATTPTSAAMVTGANFGSATITASATSYAPGSSTVQVGAALSFTVPSLTVTGTSTVSLVLSLPSAAPSQLSVNISSNAPGVASAPSTIIFPAGSSTVNVPITGVGPGVATITASAAGLTSATASVNVTAPSDITLPTGMILGPGQEQLFPITLRSAAGASGAYVNLSSSDTSKVTVTPPTVYVPPGAKTSIATPRVSAVDFGTATISANSPGLTGDNQSVEVAIKLKFLQTQVSLSGVGTSQTLALGLSAPAPAGGVTVNLVSSNPSVATITSSIFLPANVTAVSVAVNGITPGITTITATGINVGSASASVTVLAPGAIGLSSNVTVPVGQYAAFPITLGVPAIAPVTVTLTSANARKIFVTSSVVIPAGATQPVTQPLVGADNIGSVAITATAPGYAPVTATVKATTTISFDPSSMSMAPGEQKIVALALAMPAPPGHTIAGRCEIVDSDFCSTTIDMRSDNPAIAAVQPSITYYPDGSNPSIAQIIITGGTPGTTTIHAGVTGYVPEVNLTVMVLGPNAIALPGTLSIKPGQTVSYPVNLSSAAPSGGVTVALEATNTSKLTISPSSVFIAGGATAPAVQPSITGVDFGSSFVKATASGYAPGQQTVTVNGTLTLAPQNLTITSGTSSLTLTLNTTAPSALNIAVTSSNPGVAAVPSSVTIAAGASGVVVPITAGTSGTTQISASSADGLPLVASTANVTVGTVTFGGIGIPSGLSATIGQTITFPVTLSAPAPAGGITVTLSNSNGTATVTSSVLVAEGSTSPATQPQVTGVQFGNASITASAPGFTSATQTVQIGGALSFASNTLSVVRSSTGNLQLILSVAAPAGGLTVNLGSSNVGVATVPTTVNIPAGSTSVNVSVTGVTVGTATITASTSAANISGASAAITVTTPDIIIPSTMSVAAGGQTTVIVTLSQPAAAGGTFVVLTSSDTNKATLSATTVFIAQGATTPVTQPKVTGVAPGTVIITASATGLTGSSGTVQIGAGMTFGPASLSISGTGSTQQLLLTLPSAAPAGGKVVTLVSSNTSVATVPSSVTVAAGSTTANVPVTSVGAGSTGITASTAGLPNASAIVTVTAGAAIGMPVDLTIPLGGAVPYPITLGSPAPPGGVYVALTMGDNVRGKILPASVYIPGGATTPATQPVVETHNIGPNSVTASAPGYGTATQSITAVASVRFNPNTVTMRMGETGRMYLQLGSAAPPGHTTAGRCEIVDSDFCSISVNITSDNPGIAQVQPNFTYYPDGSNPAIGLVLVNPVSVGTTTIRAGLPPYIPMTTITVTVTN